MARAQRLTDAVVAALTCPAGKRDELYFDATLPGFGVRVTAAGARTFLLQYKIGRLNRRVVIGPFGELTTTQARKKAEALRGKVRDGHDPAAERQARRAALRAQAATDTFTCRALIDQWGALGLAQNKPSYRRDAPHAARRALGPHLDAPAANLTRRECVAILDRIAAERGPIVANRSRAYLRAAWAWAQRRGSIEHNPWADAPRPVSEKGRARERWLDDWELRLAWRCADDIGEPWPAFVRVLIATGQRRGEVAGMAWDELDLAAGAWRLPAERTKNGRAHVVPLAPPIVALLRERPRLDGSPFVFWGPRGSAVSGWWKPGERLHRLMQDAERAEAAAEGRIPAGNVVRLHRP